MQDRRQLRDAVEQVLGVVEREQQLERRERGQQLRERRTRPALQAERRSDRCRQHRAIGDLREADPAHTLRVGAAARVQQVLREQRLADAAGADERDQAVRIDQRAERGQIVGAPDHRRKLRRQVRAQRRG